MSPFFVILYIQTTSPSMKDGIGITILCKLLTIFLPPFIPFAWAKGGLSLTIPTFWTPFPHPSSPGAWTKKAFLLSIQKKNAEFLRSPGYKPAD